MPTYDYDCAGCGSFDAIRRVGQRDEPAPCPACGHGSARVMVAAPRLSVMAGSTRDAIAVNERAQHEPKRSGDYARLKHAAGCGCCTTGSRGATVRSASGNKAFPSKRPWMISH